jgi:hypothetical protein
MKKLVAFGTLLTFAVLMAGFGITVWEGVPPDTAVFVDTNGRTYATRQCVETQATETRYVENAVEAETPIGNTVGTRPVAVMTLEQVQNASATANYRKDDACVRAYGFLRRTGTLFTDLYERMFGMPASGSVENEALPTMAQG